MPNQNFRDDANLVDCHIANDYKTCHPAEKLCRFAYASWCPVCDMDANRKRSKSECTDSNFRKRGRDNIKTPSPKKCDRTPDSRIENKDYQDSRLNSSKVCTNLCDLPTSYISTNCQMNVPSINDNKLQPKKFSDIVDIPYQEQIKNFKTLTSELNTELSSLINNTAIENKNKIYKTPGYDNKLNSPTKIHLLHKGNEIVEAKKNEILKSFNKSNGVNVSSVPKVIRGLPIPHKDRINTSKNNPINNDTSLKSSVVKSREKEKSPVKTNATNGVDTSIIRSRVTCSPRPESKPKETPKKTLIDSTELKRDVVRSAPPILNGFTEESFKKLTNNLINSKLNIGKADDIEAKRQKVRQRNDSENSNELSVEENSDISKGAKKKPRDVSPVEIKKDIKIVKNPIKFPSVKSRHKLNSLKLRKVRSKIAHSVSSDSNHSESDSESEGDSDKETYKETFKNILSVGHTFKNPVTPVSIFTPVKSPVSTTPSKVTTSWPVRNSLFAHVPPYISFVGYDSDPIVLPPGVGRFLKWRLSTITPVIVRKTLQNTGFRLVKSESAEETNDWAGCWGKHMKSVCFQSLKDDQKLNHFPGTFQIGRKDRLWKNLQRLMFKYGQREFGFIPHTYILPHDMRLLRTAWEKTGQEKWIIKPPASARGTGIKVIHRWANLPKKRSLVVQQYISNPYLINGSKFDLRLYVLVTSFNPLRIYLYPDGLARFASTKYSDDINSLSDRYMHLTNYSINKLSSQYTANEDANACKGHKWTISKLWEFMEGKGINTKHLWRSLQDLVIKTIISGESSISQLYKANVTSRYNCYELFGIDVLLDEKLKPWLLEVNISPSLHSASPLDLHVKGPLVQTLLNLAQFHLPKKFSKMRKTQLGLNSDLYTVNLSLKERLKQVSFTEFEHREEYLHDIIDDLTGDDVRHLIQAEDELTVIGDFERIFPTKNSYHYLQFMEVRYYNRLFDAWENKYEINRRSGIKRLQLLCEDRIHLEIAQSPVSKEEVGEKSEQSLLMNVMDLDTQEKQKLSMINLKPQMELSGSCKTDAA